MLKLAIAAGITLTAFLCGMMTLRSSGLFQSNRNGELVNEIKEIFGLNRISTSNSPFSSKSGDSSSFSFLGRGEDGGYLPPKSLSEYDNYTDSLTTPVFRIYILSTAMTPSNESSSSTDFSTTPSSSTAPTSPSSSTSTTTRSIGRGHNCNHHCNVIIPTTNSIRISTGPQASI